MAKRLIIGCGYLGERVAKLWAAAGDEVYAVTRRAEQADEWQAAGWHPLIADVTKPETLSELPAVDTLLIAVGYDRARYGNDAGPSITEVYAGGIQNVLAALPEKTESGQSPRVIYISSTGVYGNAGGDVVDETTPPDPHREGGKASLAAEQVLAEHPLGKNGIVLRLAGIYGPDRLPYVKQLQAGEPIAAPGEGWLNLIHVDDAALVTLAAAESPKAPALYCVADGEPVVRKAYYLEVAKALNAPEPQFVQPAADSPRAARAAANKRISNARLVEELNVQLKYPSYREGVRAILG